METKIYPAGKPRQGEWVLQWRSGNMPAPAFWYYNSKAEAETDQAKLQDMHNRDQAHNCPECGKLTTGTHSEGGVRWALCDDCYRRMLEHQRDHLDKELSRYDDEPDPPGGYGFDKETGTGSQEPIDGWE